MDVEQDEGFESDEDIDCDEELATFLTTFAPSEISELAERMYTVRRFSAAARVAIGLDMAAAASGAINNAHHSSRLSPLRELLLIERLPPAIRTMCQTRGRVSVFFHSQIKAEFEHLYGRHITMELIGLICGEMRDYNETFYQTCHFFAVWILGCFGDCPEKQGQQFERKLVAGPYKEDMDE